MDAKRFSRSIAPLPILLALACAAASPATADAEKLEVGALGGLQLSHDVLTGNDEAVDVGVSAGLRAGYVLSPRFAWFIDALLSSVDTSEGAGHARTITARTGVEMLLNPNGTWRWFLGGGGGALDVDFQNASSLGFQRPFVSGSIGQRFGARPGLRWELRGDLTLGDEGIGGARYTQGHWLIGLDWGAGASRRREARAARPPVASPAPRGKLDSDGDGIDDSRDRCPATPPRVPVNARGCPKDADADAVADELDRCPGTPAGMPVGRDGCVLDSDGDGLTDDKDSCADTPSGAFTDASGCPIDSDGDGVAEGLDLCPTTARGAQVDADGCQRDEDSDGVPDGIDRCPQTPLSAQVDGRGCPR